MIVCSSTAVSYGCVRLVGNMVPSDDVGGVESCGTLSGDVDLFTVPEEKMCEALVFLKMPSANGRSEYWHVIVDRQQRPCKRARRRYTLLQTKRGQQTSGERATMFWLLS